MKNATMYCLCIHNKVLPIIKKLEYVPVGLGNDNFSEEWLRDNGFMEIRVRSQGLAARIELPADQIDELQLTFAPKILGGS